MSSTKQYSTKKYVPRLYTGRFVWKPQQHLSYASRYPPQSKMYEMSIGQAQNLLPYLPGIPIRKEHQETEYGKVTGAYEKDGDYYVDFLLYNNELGHTAANLIKEGACRGISLQHDPETELPVEVSICWGDSGARENSRITNMRDLLPDRSGLIAASSKKKKKRKGASLLDDDDDSFLVEYQPIRQKIENCYIGNRCASVISSDHHLKVQLLSASKKAAVAMKKMSIQDAINLMNQGGDISDDQATNSVLDSVPGMPGNIPKKKPDVNEEREMLKQQMAKMSARMKKLEEAARGQSGGKQSNNSSMCRHGRDCEYHLNCADSRTPSLTSASGAAPANPATNQPRKRPRDPVPQAEASAAPERDADASTEAEEDNIEETEDKEEEEESDDSAASSTSSSNSKQPQKKKQNPEEVESRIATILAKDRISWNDRQEVLKGMDFLKRQQKLLKKEAEAAKGLTTTAKAALLDTFTEYLHHNLKPKDAKVAEDSLKQFINTPGASTFLSTPFAHGLVAASMANKMQQTTLDRNEESAKRAVRSRAKRRSTATPAAASSDDDEAAPGFTSASGNSARKPSSSSSSSSSDGQYGTDFLADTTCRMFGINDYSALQEKMSQPMTFKLPGPDDYPGEKDHRGFICASNRFNAPSHGGSFYAPRVPRGPNGERAIHTAAPWFIGALLATSSVAMDNQVSQTVVHPDWKKKRSDDE